MTKQRIKFLSIALMFVCAFAVFFSNPIVFSKAETLENRIEINAIESISDERVSEIRSEIDNIAASNGYSVKFSYLDILEDYYLDFVSFCEGLDNKIEVMSFKEFYDDFYSQDILSISEYVVYLEDSVAGMLSDDPFENSTMSSSSGDKWYYNFCQHKNCTDNCQPKQQPKYGKYSFSLLTGDILYEDEGGPSGITNHIAIVEGRFDSKYGYYWRLVESIKPGVSRSVLDDDRFLQQKGTIYYVPSATSTKLQGAVNFCIYQLGKPWSLQLTKPTDKDHPRWQCSTMVWAAYKCKEYGDQSIDIEQTGWGSGPGITPNDIRDASTTSFWMSYK